MCIYSLICIQNILIEKYIIHVFSVVERDFIKQRDIFWNYSKELS